MELHVRGNEYEMSCPRSLKLSLRCAVSSRKQMEISGLERQNPFAQAAPALARHAAANIHVPAPNTRCRELEHAASGISYGCSKLKPPGLAMQGKEHGSVHELRES